MARRRKKVPFGKYDPTKTAFANPPKGTGGLARECGSGLILPDHVAARRAAERANAEEDRVANPMEQLEGIQLLLGFYAGRRLNLEEQMIAKHLLRAHRAAERAAKSWVARHTRGMEKTDGQES